MLPVSPVDPTAPALIKRSQTPPPGKAFAQRRKVDRSTSATSEPVIAESPRNCPTSALGDHCKLTAFQPPAIDAPTLRPNPLELSLSRLFVMGTPSAVPAQGL